MLTGSLRYGDEDKLLAWLYELDRQERFMKFRKTAAGREMTDSRVRQAMRTLVGLGLATCDEFRQRRTGCETGAAEITGDGIIVIREHFGRIAEWRMFGHGRSGNATTNVTTNNQIVEGAVTNSQLAAAGVSTDQVQADGRGQQTPSQAEAMLRALFARSYEVTRQLGDFEELTELMDEIEDAEAMVIALLRSAAPQPSDRLDAVEAVQRRLARVAKRIRDAATVKEIIPEAAELVRDLGEQLIR